MKYEFNNDGSYTIPQVDFISIGLQNVKFKSISDMQDFIVYNLMHEHMHKAIEKVTDTRTCVLFDLITKKVQYHILPHVETVLRRNGFMSCTKEQILNKYKASGLL